MKRILSTYIFCVLIISSLTIGNAQTWTSLNGPKIATSIKDITVTANGNDLYLAEGGSVLKSVDNGISGTGWRETIIQYQSPLYVLVKPSDAAIVIATKNADLSYSANSGATWTQKSGDPNLIPLRLSTVINDNTVMLLGRKYYSGSHSIWRGINSGVNWSAVTSFTAATDINDFAPYPRTGDGQNDVVWACGSAGTTQGSNKSQPASSRGLWLSTDKGASWSGNYLGDFELRSIAIIPKSSGTDYYRFVVKNNASGTNDEVLRSTNLSDPESWTTVFNGAAEVRLVRVDKSNNNVYIATSNGVYRSTSEGASSTWGNPKTNGMVGSDVDILSLAIDSENDIVYAGTASTLYRSTDQGDSWENVGDMNASSVAFSGSSVWAVTKDNAYASKYNGSAWTNYYMTTAGSSFTGNQILFRSTNSGGELWVSGVESGNAKLYRTTDGGANYVSKGPTSSGGAFYGTIKHPTQSDMLYLFGGATVSSAWKNYFSTTDNGTNWSSDNIGSASLNVNDVNVIDVSGTTKSYAALSNGTVYRKVGNESGFTLKLSMTGTNPVAKTVAINPNISGTVYAGGTTGIWKSTDGGDNWSNVSNNSISRIIFDPRFPGDANHVWALATDGQNIYKTDNGGTSWSTLNTSGVPKPINDIKSLNSGYIYLSTTDGVYIWDIEPAAPINIVRDTDNGHPKISWTANLENDLKTGYKYQVYRFLQLCEYIGPNKITCSASGPDELVCTTDLLTFTDANFGIMVDPELEFYRATYYVRANDFGGHYSEPSASEWYYGLPYDYNKTVFHQPLAEEKPNSYALDANYPNPFNPSTEINYALPEDAHVKLIVYNNLGQEIAVVVNELQTAGFKTASFDGSNLPSGLYFYRLNAGKFSKTGKMMLLK